MIDCKICGLANLADLKQADAAGARWGGFVFYPKSPRHITLSDAADIAIAADRLHLTIMRVALVVNAENSALDAIVKALNPGMIQCHGDESPDRILAIKSRYKRPVMKAVRIANLMDIQAALRYDEVADWMLFDSAPVDAILPGGTGHSFDWTLMRSYMGKTPWLLAGGLTADTIHDAVKASGTKHLDVSSGVEKSAGIKDHKAITAFVEAAKQIEQTD
ncbi:MAG TPA: phosphoribosylanthranilate isomerase [Alphaproteobacteria bacterium]|nr:phosphoribosylanthranilate isomerase [Alphaproteobacteria bacterium]